MIHLTDIERKDLRKRQREEKNKQLYIRITVLLMLDSHFSIPQIEASLGIDQTTVNRYINAYKDRGLSQYLRLNYVGYEGKLTPTEIAQLDKELQDYLYINTYEVIDFIKTHFGKSYTPSGASVLLHRMGFTYKKTKHEPSKADTAKQTAFLNEMTAFLAEIEYNSESAVAYFVDAVHPAALSLPSFLQTRTPPRTARFSLQTETHYSHVSRRASATTTSIITCWQNRSNRFKKIQFEHPLSIEPII